MSAHEDLASEVAVNTSEISHLEDDVRDHTIEIKEITLWVAGADVKLGGILTQMSDMDDSVKEILQKLDDLNSKPVRPVKRAKTRESPKIPSTATIIPTGKMERMSAIFLKFGGPRAADYMGIALVVLVVGWLANQLGIFA